MTLAARACHPRFATCSRARNQDETTARREAPTVLALLTQVNAWLAITIHADIERRGA